MSPKSVPAASRYNLACGVSRAALGAGMFAAASVASPAFAAPDPLMAAPPTPTAPAEPGNPEQCTQDMAVFTCAPGLDTDGVGVDPLAGAEGVTINIQEGAFVRNDGGGFIGAVTTYLGGTVTNDGTVVGDGATGFSMNSSETSPSTLTNNGFVQSNVGNLYGTVYTNEFFTLNNTGTISGVDTASVYAFGGLTVTNSGLIQSDGNSAPAILDQYQTTITNDVTGQIFSTGDFSTGILAFDDLTLDNAGLIQTFGTESNAISASSADVVNSGTIATLGDDSGGIIVSGELTLDNSGMISTAGNGAEAVEAGDNSSVTNSGSISTEGSDSKVLDLGDFAMIDNSGEISSMGDNSGANSVGNQSTITNSGSIDTGGANSNAVTAVNMVVFDNSGTIATSGNDSAGLKANNGADVTNSGTMTTEGTDASVLDLGGGAEVENSGTIAASGFESTGISAGNGSQITNLEGGSISSMQSDAVRVEQDSTVTNSGLIATEGGAAIQAGGQDNVTVANTASGVIEALGTDAGSGIMAGANLTVSNDGMISSETSDAIIGTTNAAVTNTGQIESGMGDGVQLVSGTITNSGTIESLSSDPANPLVIGGTTPELDAAIVFAADPADLDEDGVVNNLAGGVIVGDIGIVASPGNQTDPASNDGVQAVYNAGTITGTYGALIGTTSEAVLLGGGNDIFFKVDGGMEVGNVDGGSGTDSFYFGVTSDVDQSFDLALIGTQYLNFENIAFGTLDFDPMGLSADPTLGTGVITLTGATATSFTIANTAILDGMVTGGIVLEEVGGGTVEKLFTITENGSIEATGEDAIRAEADGFTIVNNGLVQADGASTSGIRLMSDSTVVNNGSILTLADDINDAVSFDENLTLENNGLIETQGEDSYVVYSGGAGNATITNSASGEMITNGLDTIVLAIDGLLDLDNAGLIQNNGDDSTAIAADDLFLMNSGTIEANGDPATTISAETADITNSGSITSASNYAIVVNGAADIENLAGGTISSDGANAIELSGGGSMVDNGGMIQSGEGDGLQLVSGTVINSGSIVSLASNPANSLIIGDTTPELDAGIVFAADPADLDEDGTVTNLAGGLIEGDIGIVATPGNQDNPDTNDGVQEVYNAGTIVGRMGDAVLLGNGNDLFEQQAGGLVTGRVDLQDGDDMFRLTGTASSIADGVFGGAGTDTAMLMGTYDADILSGFELIQVGDNRFVGDRTVTGDTTIDGTAVFDLGIDSLLVDGDLTLTADSTISILTSLDLALLSMGPITVLDETGTFTNEGTTVDIDDDDLLIDYTFEFGSLTVTAIPVNPVATSSDPNVVAFGNAVLAGVTNGTIDATNASILNGLGSQAEFEAAAAAAMPATTGGVAREIFEASNLASHALDRHLAGEGSAIWGQAAIRGSSQDALSLTAGGYDGDAQVFTIGADIATAPGVVFGILGSYASIDVDDLSGNAVREKSEIDSYKVALYSALNWGQGGFVHGEVGYQFSNVDTMRTGALGPIASSYDANGFVARAVAGYDLVPSPTVAVTPTVGFNYAKVDFDRAEESGGFDFTVDRESFQFAELRAGIEASGTFGGVTPYVSGTYVFDLDNDPRRISLSSTQLGSFDIMTPGRDNGYFELAAGATVLAGSKVSISVGYLGEFSDGYDSHAGVARFRLLF